MCFFSPSFSPSCATLFSRVVRAWREPRVATPTPCLARVVGPFAPPQAASNSPLPPPRAPSCRRRPPSPGAAPPRVSLLDDYGRYIVKFNTQSGDSERGYPDGEATVGKFSPSPTSHSSQSLMIGSHNISWLTPTANDEWYVFSRAHSAPIEQLAYYVHRIHHYDI